MNIDGITIICTTLLKIVIIIGCIYTFCFLLKEKQLPREDTFKVAFFVLVIFADIFVASLGDAVNSSIWGILGTLSGVIVIKLIETSSGPDPKNKDKTPEEEKSKVI